MKNIFAFKEFSFNFVGLKKLWYAIALCLMIPGLVVLCFLGFNQGIDFTGGTYVIVSYEDTVALEDVRNAVSGITSQTPSINESEGNTFTIKTEMLTPEDSDEMLSVLSQLGNMSIDHNELVGPVIGAELLRNAQWALMIAGVLMLAYITIRFKFNFALTAILALCHDVIVLLSMFAIFRIEINSYFIAAILTILGYSINNTIVVYDRIRENLKFYGSKNEKEIVNSSINETLTRSINTTAAVLILLLALLFFGGDTTRNFVLAMTIGVCAGFFSSAFLAGNLLLDVSRLLGFKLTGKKDRSFHEPGKKFSFKRG